MPLGAVVLVRAKKALGEEELAHLRRELKESFGLDADDFYLEGPIVALLGDDFPIPAGAEMGFWYNLNVHRAYYGPGYRRGDISLFVRLAEWAEGRIPGAHVYYGHDADDSSIHLFDADRRGMLLAEKPENGGR